MESGERQSILHQLAEYSTPERPVYLVGGAVRDMLLNIPAHDLDFVLPGGTRKLAQDAACRLDGALYRLDEERDTTRVVLEANPHRRERMVLDFAALRAPDLSADLFARDFTINALAVDLAAPEKLIDPTGGLADLRAQVIRACSPDSLTNDPVRVLRGVRQAVKFNFRIDPQTLQMIKDAVPLLDRPSPERLRDELFRMLEGPRVGVAVRLLDQVGGLAHLLPEINALKGVTQSAPHIDDVWNHTLAVVQSLQALLSALVGEYDAAKVSDLTVGSAVLWLGRYRQQLSEHFAHRLVPDRSALGLLFLAALYHDIAKPETRMVTAEGRIRFLDHPILGAQAVVHRARALVLSAAEINRLEKIVEHHMRIHFLADSARDSGRSEAALQSAGLYDKDERPSRRAIYRFFKDTGEAGVDICLLALADLRGTYGAGLPQDLWERELRTVRALLEAYWEMSTEVVKPVRLLTGHELIDTFHLIPGPIVGHLMGAIQEAQAAGEIGDREAAVDFAQAWLKQHAAAQNLSREKGEE